MKLNRILLGLGLLGIIVLTGCGNEANVHTEGIVNFDNQQDLSIYYVNAQEEAKAEPVELKANLDYVDTAYVMKIKEAVGEINPTRSTYSDYPAEWDFVLIDSRPANVFSSGHINGAINIPDAQFEKFSNLLPDDKSKLLIFYCGGMQCELSGNSAEKAQKLGYENIKVYQEGIPAWTKEGNYLTVTSEHVKNSILEANVTNENKTPVLILDARPYSKYFESHIPNAIFADDTIFTQKFSGVVPKDKSTELIVYCGGFSCQKSHTVASHLINSGYTNVKVYSGGLPDWTAQKLPTFGTVGNVNGFNVSEGKIDRGLTPEHFVEKLKNTSNVQVLDVRGPAEVANGMIPGAINIPDGEIHADANKIASLLPKDKNTTILIHCASGARASGVVNKIADLGYPNTYYLNHAIAISSDGGYSFP